MARVAGVDIPDGKQILISLTYIYGVGRHTSEKILKAVGIDPNVRTKDLTHDELARIANEIEDHHQVEGMLRRMRNQNIQRLKEINSYRGLRHRRNLPVRGQRTRTNARTRKGPRRTVATKRGIKDIR